jgi:hypothetical protein
MELANNKLTVNITILCIIIIRVCVNSIFMARFMCVYFDLIRMIVSFSAAASSNVS